MAPFAQGALPWVQMTAKEPTSKAEKTKMTKRAKRKRSEEKKEAQLGPQLLFLEKCRLSSHLSLVKSLVPCFLKAPTAFAHPTHPVEMAKAATFFQDLKLLVEMAMVANSVQDAVAVVESQRTAGQPHQSLYEMILLLPASADLGLPTSEDATLLMVHNQMVSRANR